MNEKFAISPAIIRYQNQIILLFIVLLITWTFSGVVKLPAVYLTQWPPFSVSIINLTFSFFMWAIFIWSIKITQIIKQGYLELTDEAVVVVGRPAFTLRFSEITKWEIFTSTDQKITDVLVWKQGRKYDLSRFTPLEKIAQQLETKLSIKPQTLTYHWLATYPKSFVVLQLFLYLCFFNEPDLYPYLMVLPLLFYGGCVLAYFAFYQRFFVKGESFIILLLGLFLSVMLFSNTSRLQEKYIFHPCSQIAQTINETGCIRYFGFESTVLGFTPDQTALVLGNPQHFRGILIQSITGWWPQFSSTFIPTTYVQKLSTQGNLLLTRQGDTGQLTTLDLPSGQLKKQYPFDLTNKVILSPAGHYLLIQINARYEVLDLENGQQTLLPELNLNSAVFSADEQQLYLLTYTELLVWDTQQKAISHTLAPPAEWQGRSWSCLNFLGPDEFLLLIDNHELWRWSINENHTQKLFTSELRNIQKCEFTHGADWLLVEDYTNLQLFNLADGRLLWQTDPMRFDSWAVSPDGRYLAGSDSDYTYLFDFELLRQQK